MASMTLPDFRELSDEQLAGLVSATLPSSISENGDSVPEPGGEDTFYLSPTSERTRQSPVRANTTAAASQPFIPPQPTPSIPQEFKERIPRFLDFSGDPKQQSFAASAHAQTPSNSIDVKDPEAELLSGRSEDVRIHEMVQEMARMEMRLRASEEERLKIEGKLSFEVSKRKEIETQWKAVQDSWVEEKKRVIEKSASFVEQELMALNEPILELESKLRRAEKERDEANAAFRAEKKDFENTMSLSSSVIKVEIPVETQTQATDTDDLRGAVSAGDTSSHDRPEPASREKNDSATQTETQTPPRVKKFTLFDAEEEEDLSQMSEADALRAELSRALSALQDGVSRMVVWGVRAEGLRIAHQKKKKADSGKKSSVRGEDGSTLEEDCEGEAADGEAADAFALLKAEARDKSASAVGVLLVRTPPTTTPRMWERAGEALHHDLLTPGPERLIPGLMEGGQLPGLSPDGDDREREVGSTSTAIDDALRVARQAVGEQMEPHGSRRLSPPEPRAELAQAQAERGASVSSLASGLGDTIDAIPVADVSPGSVGMIAGPEPKLESFDLHGTLGRARSDPGRPRKEPVIYVATIAPDHPDDAAHQSTQASAVSDAALGADGAPAYGQDAPTQDLRLGSWHGNGNNNNGSAGDEAKAVRPNGGAGMQGGSMFAAGCVRCRVCTAQRARLALVGFRLQCARQVRLRDVERRLLVASYAKLMLRGIETWRVNAKCIGWESYCAAHVPHAENGGVSEDEDEGSWAWA